jgi:outer membrane protein assembly factor BamD (BamD/ComL family)
MKKLYLLICFLTFFAHSNALPAGKRKSFTSEEDAKNYLNTHYNKGAHFFNEESWRDASNEFEKVIYFFPDSAEAAEASYFLAICYFEMKEYDFANAEFNGYLKASAQPEYFEDALNYKYYIAEKLGCGSKRRPFKYRYFPKFMEGQTLALEIYDEIVTTVPNHELAVCALFAKASLLEKLREYRESIDTYQLLIRRFPKHELAPESYLKISQAYYQMSRLDSQNPDVLGLAELNFRKFSEDFPRDERVKCAEEYAQTIREVLAGGLCNVGQFYARTGHPEAAAIYYQSAIEQYPGTKVAKLCASRVNELDYTKEADEKLIPLDQEQPHPGPIMLDPQKGYEVESLPDTKFDED